MPLLACTRRRACVVVPPTLSCSRLLSASCQLLPRRFSSGRSWPFSLIPTVGGAYSNPVYCPVTTPPFTHLCTTLNRTVYADSHPAAVRVLVPAVLSQLIGWSVKPTLYPLCYHSRRGWPLGVPRAALIRMRFRMRLHVDGFWLLDWSVASWRVLPSWPLPPPDPPLAPRWRAALSVPSSPHRLRGVPVFGRLL